MQEPEISAFAIADDLMVPPIVVGEGEDVNAALEILLLHGAREIVVVDDDGRIVGLPGRGGGDEALPCLLAGRRHPGRQGPVMPRYLMSGAATSSSRFG